MQLANARLILPDAMTRGSLVLRQGRIARVQRGAGAASKSSETLNCRGYYLAPGFIDLHIHGALGRDTMEATPDAFRAITRFHLEGGTTSIALTTVTAAEKEILNVLEAARPLQNSSLGGSRIVGVHVEGPFIS